MWLGLPRLNLLLRRHLEIKGGGGWAAASIPLERTGVCVFWSQILSIGQAPNAGHSLCTSIGIRWITAQRSPLRKLTMATLGQQQSLTILAPGWQETAKSGRSSIVLLMLIFYFGN